MRRFLDAMSGPARNKVVTAGATLLRERSTGAEPTATRGTDPESLARRDTRAPAPIPSIRRAAGPSTKVARSGDIETAEAGVEVGVEAGVEVEREDIDSINPCVVSLIPLIIYKQASLACAAQLADTACPQSPPASA